MDPELREQFMERYAYGMMLNTSEADDFGDVAFDPVAHLAYGSAFEGQEQNVASAQYVVPLSTSTTPVAGREAVKSFGAALGTVFLVCVIASCLLIVGSIVLRAFL